MSFLKNLFSPKSETPEGLWLRGYRDCSWQLAFTYSIKQGQVLKVEVGFDSCYRIKKGVFSILRVQDPDENVTTYIASLINDGVDEILWLVIRAEDDNGNCLKQDKWCKNVGFSEEKIPGVKNGVIAIRNMCGLANLKTTPPYMLILSLNKEKWM